ncbi:13592_t:CDS:2 [Entrophospora sp. SA101]|nr:13592_t:CDS:2 [Entrophospora sp. SA101]
MTAVETIAERFERTERKLGKAEKKLEKFEEEKEKRLNEKNDGVMIKRRSGKQIKGGPLQLMPTEREKKGTPTKIQQKQSICWKVKQKSK